MPNRVTLEGIEKVIEDFESFQFSGRKVVPRYLDLITSSALDLLKENTPKDEGILANSWTVLERGSNHVVIGVPDEQEGLLQAIIGGTLPHDIVAPEGKSLGPFLGPDGNYHWSKKVHVKGITANNFVQQIDSFINGLMDSTLTRLWSQTHRFAAPFSGKSNLSKIVGQTGVTYNRRRQFGRTSMIRPRTGRISNRVRIGRRRRVGSVANIKKIQLG